VHPLQDVRGVFDRDETLFAGLLRAQVRWKILSLKGENLFERGNVLN
jgi:hypothetical protein